LVLRCSLLGGLVFAPKGGLTFAQAVKSDRLRQQTVMNRLFKLLLEGLKSAILTVIFL
jgi:Fic family protein